MLIHANDTYYKDTSLLIKTVRGWYTKDNSPTNITITPNGNVRPSLKSPFSGYEGSTYFDGSGDWLSIAAGLIVLGASDFTIECWVYPGATGTKAILIGQSDLNTASGSSFGFFISNGATTSDLYIGGSATSIASPNPATGAWSHVAWVRTGSTYSSYLNGTRVGTSTISGTVNTGATTYPATIGSFATGSNTYTGYISNLRVIKGAGGYNATGTTITVPVVPLASVTNTILLTCQSQYASNNNTFLDYSSNDYLITKTGSCIQGAINPYNSLGSGSGSVTGTGTWYLSTSGDHRLTGDFEISAWIKRDTTMMVIASVGSESTGRIAFGVDATNGGRLFYGIYNDATDYNFGNTIATGTWAFVQFIRSGTTITGYVNGVSVGTKTLSGTLGNASGITFCNIASGALSSTGYFSDIRISTVSRTASIPTAPLVSDINTRFLLGFRGAAIYDATQKNNIETVGGVSVSSAMTRFGQPVIFFDGTTGYLNVPDSANLNLGSVSHSIEGWIYPTTVSAGSRTVLAKNWNGVNTYGYVVLVNTSTFNVYVSNNNANWNVINGANLGMLSANTGYHFSIIRNGSSWGFNINGTQVATSSNAGAIYNNSSPLTIGAANPTATAFFQGYMSELRITKGVPRPNIAPIIPYSTY